MNGQRLSEQVSSHFFSVIDTLFFQYFDIVADIIIVIVNRS